MQVGTVVVLGTEKGRSGALGSPDGSEPGRIDLPVIQTPPATSGGHSLSEPQFREQPGAVEFAVDARYDWDAGEAVGAFLQALQEGRLVGRRCDGCDRVLVPPRMFCERCFGPTDAWVDVPSAGRVETFSICHVSWDMRTLDPPEVPAVVHLDGSDGGILHKLGDVDPADVSIGMTVEAVWRPPNERAGSILDIAYFRPAEGDRG